MSEDSKVITSCSTSLTRFLLVSLYLTPIKFKPSATYRRVSGDFEKMRNFEDSEWMRTWHYACQSLS